MASWPASVGTSKVQVVKKNDIFSALRRDRGHERGEGGKHATSDIDVRLGRSTEGAAAAAVIFASHRWSFWVRL